MCTLLRLREVKDLPGKQVDGGTESSELESHAKPHHLVITPYCVLSWNADFN